MRSDSERGDAAKRPNRVQDEWDFYPCKVDERPASIFLNFWFSKNGPVASADTLYWCHIEMLEPGDHGMGTGEDVQELNRIEDIVTGNAEQLGLFHVGRLRNDGRWQLVFYGKNNLESSLRETTANAICSSARRSVVGSKADAQWSYYFDFLLPDAERWQYIKDRRVVNALKQHGDELTGPRRVDHWVYFPDVADRDEFVQNIEGEGFHVEELSDNAEGEYPCLAHVFRNDSVELDEIHATVMLLIRTAEPLKGQYDGWEASVEKP
jgi:hypothetical protein